MLEAAARCGESDGYRYDLADVSRQVLADLEGRYHRAIVQAYARRDSAAVSRLSEKMLGLIRDLDRLLATQREFLLGIWLADARKFGASAEEKDLCERNARELLTTWNNKDAATDYANRQWAGLVGTFYFARWELWLDALRSALAADQSIDVAAVRARIREHDLAWTRQHDTYPSDPQGETVAISRRLFETYTVDASDSQLGVILAQRAALPAR
jgi:alpha-N-acetylglucosaminidase